MSSPGRGPQQGHDDSGREPSPFIELDRAAWAALAAETESPLTAEEVRRLRGLGDSLDIEEVREVYLPLSRLLSMYVGSAGRLHRKQEEFLQRPVPPRTPFVIGLAGSVAVGKSTTARVLQQMLAHWPEPPNGALVTTDGFLYPNAELERQRSEINDNPYAPVCRRCIDLVAEKGDKTPIEWIGDLSHAQWRAFRKMLDVVAAQERARQAKPANDAGHSDMSAAVDEAARIDGASEFGIYWRVVLPLLKPALGALTILLFIFAWNNFLWSFSIWYNFLSRSSDTTKRGQSKACSHKL